VKAVRVSDPGAVARRAIATLTLIRLVRVDDQTTPAVYTSAKAAPTKM